METLEKGFSVMRALITKFKVVGYGAYIVLVNELELLGGEMSWGEGDMEVCSDCLGITVKKLGKVVEACVRYGLFKVEDGKLIQVRKEGEDVGDKIYKMITQNAQNEFKNDLLSIELNKKVNKNSINSEEITPENAPKNAKLNKKVNQSLVIYENCENLKEKETKKENEEKEKRIKEKEEKERNKEKETPLGYISDI